MTIFCIDCNKVKLTENLKTAYFHNTLNMADDRFEESWGKRPVTKLIHDIDWPFEK